MPNHITNQLKIIASKEKINEIKEYLKIKYDDVVIGMDFNKIIPMPKNLDLTSGTIEDISLSVYILENPYSEIAIKRSKKGWFIKLDKEYISNYLKYHKDKSYQDLLELGKQYYKNIKEYGFTTWYDWCSEYWGTKWNAYKSELEDTEDTIYFNTAWAGVPKLIEILSYKFPDVEFEYKYADENFGYNVGSYVFKNGNKYKEEIFDNTKRAYDLACEVMQTTLKEHCINENYEYDESLEDY